MSSGPEFESSQRFVQRVMLSSALGLVVGVSLISGGESPQLNRECAQEDTAAEEVEVDTECDGPLISVEIPVRTAAGGVIVLASGFIGVGGLAWAHEPKTELPARREDKSSR